MLLKVFFNKKLVMNIYNPICSIYLIESFKSYFNLIKKFLNFEDEKANYIELHIFKT